MIPLILLALLAAAPTQPITLHYHRSEDWVGCCAHGKPAHYNQDVQRDFVIAPEDVLKVIQLKDEYPINVPLSGSLGAGKARLWGPVRMRGQVWVQLDLGGNPVAAALDAERDQEIKQAVGHCLPADQLIGQPGIDQIPTQKVMLTYDQVRDLAHFKGRWPPPGHERSNPADPNCGGVVTIEMTATGPPTGKPVVDGASCACQGKTVLLHAYFDGAPAGTFLPFKVSGGGAPTGNSGGDAPAVTLQGNAKSTGAATVVAVFQKKDGTKIESAPFQVHFAQVDTPKVVANGYSVNGGARDFCFSSGSSPHIELAFTGQGWLDGADASERLRWNTTSSWLQQKVDSGRKLTLSADEMPHRSADFGDLTAKASLQDQGCACLSDGAQARTFFRRDDQNGPSPDLPNWAYYWQQTSAGQGVPFKIGINDCGTSNPDDAKSGGYNYCEDTIYVPQNKPDLACRFPPPSRHSHGRRNIGIDCFAQTLRHENQHRKEFHAWWPPNGVPSSNPADDEDVDRVPVWVEKDAGCDDHNQHSCPNLPFPDVTDLEMTAYDVGWTWDTGSADKEDWACPGKQCPNPGGE